MDKDKLLDGIQEKTEELKGKAEELHRNLEEQIAHRKQKHIEEHYVELGADSNDSLKDEYGLVLGGGGGRGSYEIGVWKALMEYSDVIHVGAVSGSSVGALNAALFACGDLDKAVLMWHDITNDRILSNKDIGEDRRSRLFDYIKEKILTIDNPVIKNAIECIGLDAVAKGMKIKDGFFSREGLTEILEDSGILEGVSGSSINCYATCLRCEGRPVPERFQLAGMDTDDIEQILLASSAIPVIFPMETIDETRYYDGGFFLGGDNVPVSPLYDEGYRKFIVVHLDDRKSDTYEDADMIHIYPSVPLGGTLDGMLDFSHEGVEKRIAQGYEDAKRVLTGIFGEIPDAGDKTAKPEILQKQEKDRHPCIYFTRHGQTIWNVENKICGQTDIELTELGHRQAVELGQEIRNGDYHIDEIISSPLVRAYDTACHISEITGIPMRTDDRLTEQCFGKYEGTARNGAEFGKAKTHFFDHYGDGESMAVLCQRIYNLLDDLVLENRTSGKTYLIVAHNGIARIVNSYFHDMTNEEFAAFGIKNCEVRKFDLE